MSKVRMKIMQFYTNCLRKYCQHHFIWESFALLKLVQNIEHFCDKKEEDNQILFEEEKVHQQNISIPTQ
jgi:hypothetical protein